MTKYPISWCPYTGSATPIWTALNLQHCGFVWKFQMNFKYWVTTCYSALRLTLPLVINIAWTCTCYIMVAWFTTVNAHIRRREVYQHCRSGSLKLPLPCLWRWPKFSLVQHRTTANCSFIQAKSIAPSPGPAQKDHAGVRVCARYIIRVSSGTVQWTRNNTDQSLSYLPFKPL